MTTETDRVRVLPAVQPRVESGAIQFGDDWPGTFIRGDNAGYFAMNLQQLLGGEAAAVLSPFELLTLRSLQNALAGAVVGPAAGMVAGASAFVFDGLPEQGQYFRHTDGGYYRRKGVARYSEDAKPLVVYEHLWPFERCDWARPEEQWASRFKPVALAEVRQAMQGSREQAQADVAEAKRKRREAAAG